MRKKTKTEDPWQDPVDDEVDELVDAPQDARLEAHERAQQCSEEIRAILTKYQCQIMPRIDPSMIEPVGVAGDKIQVRATWWLAPLAAAG